MPGLGLDRLDDEADRVRSDGPFQGFGVPEGDDRETGREGPVVVAVQGLGGEADEGDRPAVEVVRAGDDLGLVRGDALDLIAPFPGGLDGGFDGLGPGVHRQDHLVTGPVAELFCQQGPLVVPEGPGRQGQALRLGLEGLDDPGVAVPLVRGRVGGQEIEVFLAFDVPHPDPLGLADDHVQGVIVVGSVEVFEEDEIFAVHCYSPMMMTPF